MNRWQELITLFNQPASETMQKRFYLGVFVSSVFVGVVCGLFFSPFGFVDDAYITLHNAQVVLSGAKDPNYMGSSPFAGSTSLPHMLLLVPFLLILPPLWAVWAVATLGMSLYLLAVTRLAFLYQTRLWQVLGLILLAATVANMPYQLFNGLETGLAMAGVMWALCVAASPSKRYRFLLPLLCGLLPFLRPELVACSGLLLLYAMWRVYTEEDKSFQQMGGHTLKALPWLLLGALPWLLSYWVGTGSPIPLTVGAKKAYFAEGCSEYQWKWQVMSEGISSLCVSTGFALAALPLLFRSLLGRLGFLFGAVFFSVYFLQFPGALGHYYYRYMYILFPFLFLSLIEGLAEESLWLSRFTMVVLLASCLQHLLLLPPKLDLIYQHGLFTQRTLKRKVGWLKKHVPPDATILIHDAGYISFQTPFRLVDLVGLKTASSISQHQKLTLPTCGKMRHLAVHRIALQNDVRYLVVLNSWDKIFHLALSLSFHGWKVRRLYKQPKGYSVFRVIRPVKGARNKKTPPKRQ